MIDETPEAELRRRQWLGFWCMILQQTQNAFNDKFAQFTLIPLGGAVAFAILIPIGKAIELDVPSVAGVLMALPMVLFAPVAGWLSDRFSKRDVMLGAAIAQVLVLAGICLSVVLKSMPLALCGFFALAAQSAFFSPAKFGINKELVGSKHLGFAAGIQQMTAMLAILTGQIAAGYLFDIRFKELGGGDGMAWKAALAPLLLLAGLSVPALALALAVPRVPAQNFEKFSLKLTVSHFISLADLWRDIPLRRASFGVAFFWGFAAFINLWSVKLAQLITHGGKGFGTLSSEFMAAASLGMAAGFGCASLLQRKRIELGWVPVAGFLMTASAVSLAFMTPGGWFFLTFIGLLAFSGALFLAPLNAWMQDRYPAAKRGELQAAVNLQDCLAGIVAVIVIGIFEYGARVFGIHPDTGFRIEIAFIGLLCGLMTFSCIRLLPGDFIRLIGSKIIRVIYRIQTVHSENIPASGGALILPNHVSFADAFFISSACPRPVRFVMDETFMSSRTIRMFVSIFDTVTIRRDQPLEAIRITISALKKGDLVCLFPEGQITRTGTLCELQRGFELIAKKANHPLIPLWCDGSWGSIFSFERGKFFNKLPRRFRSGMHLDFGTAIESKSISLESVRGAIMKASADAQAQRFAATRWSARIPRGNSRDVEMFRGLPAEIRRRIWINGYQIGQVNGLQRDMPFSVLNGENNLLGIILTFPEWFGAIPSYHLLFEPKEQSTWVGGDELREFILQSSILEDTVFYDFGTKAHEPLNVPKVTHFPCLAVEGVVIAMSMPDPAQPTVSSELQLGSKPKSWGKLLPGWYLSQSESGALFAHGPAAPTDGLSLPDGCHLDADGFLLITFV